MYLLYITHMNQENHTAPIINTKNTMSTSALSRPMVGAHIARNTQPPTQYLGTGRGYSTYYPMLF